MKRGKARAIVVNSGNSNTFTGKAGIAVVERHRGGDGENRQMRAERGVYRLHRA